MVCVQSIVAGQMHDDSCVLQPGDHRFIQHPSFIRYDRCRKEPIAKLQKAVNDGVISPHDPMPPEIYDRICEGLRTSIHAPPWARTWLTWHDNLAD